RAASPQSGRRRRRPARSAGPSSGRASAAQGSSRPGRAHCPRSTALRGSPAPRWSENPRVERPFTSDRGLTRVVSRPTFGSTQGGVGRWVRQTGPRSPEALAHMALQPDLYFISMAARMLDMHPQTLRKYERLGLVSPTRTMGSIRVYTDDELERLKLIKHLGGEPGVNLAGVQRLLSIAESVQRIRPLMHEEENPDARRRLAREI